MTNDPVFWLEIKRNLCLYRVGRSAKSITPSKRMAPVHYWQLLNPWPAEEPRKSIHAGQNGNMRCSARRWLSNIRKRRRSVWFKIISTRMTRVRFTRTCQPMKPKHWQRALNSISHRNLLVGWKWLKLSFQLYPGSAWIAASRRWSSLKRNFWLWWRNEMPTRSRSIGSFPFNRLARC